MGTEEKVKEAQRLLDWVITYLNFSMKCKVTGYKRENYRVEAVKSNKLAMPVEIVEQDVQQINPGENFIPDKIKTLFTNLERY